MIDLIHLDLLDAFFQLSHFELKTTDFVFDELHLDQKMSLNSYIETEKLVIITSEEEEMMGVFILFSQNTGLSFPDCSV